MRETLINLISRARTAMWGKNIPDIPAEDAFIADDLIANGVIVPPVKVGQKLYTIPRSAIREWTVAGVWISADPKCSYAHVYWEKNGHHMNSLAVNFSDLDRTFFFSREEAEAALAEPPKGE